MIPAIFGLSGPHLTADERAFFRDADPAGYILFARNCASPEQLRSLTDDLRSIHGRDHLLVSIDQEGGRVARLRPPLWSAYPCGEAFDRLYELAPASAIEAARANATAMGQELSAMGITVDYHPPLDLRLPGAHDVIGDRALGRDPMQVAALGRAILDGLAAGGVAGCIKHMPGHGRSDVDTHKALPTVTASAAELEADIAPFRTLNQALIGMTGHLLFPVWDALNPATLSPTIIADIIRGLIGFDGLLLTDDIDMEALGGTIPERAARAHAAGCDIILNCWAKMADMQAICAALPTMPATTTARLDRALAGTRIAPAMAPDHAGLLAKRDELLALTGAAA
ncbi:MAG: beta-N-acetylhexosaminidase [Erythrobacter sp.]|nr:beta-N-acetylhexosaminidase [Erythrobacter sp.]